MVHVRTSNDYPHVVSDDQSTSGHTSGQGIDGSDPISGSHRMAARSVVLQ